MAEDYEVPSYLLNTANQRIKQLEAENERLLFLLNRAMDRFRFISNIQRPPTVHPETFIFNLQANAEQAVVNINPDPALGNGPEPKVTESCGCVFKDIDVECRDPECRVCK